MDRIGKAVFPEHIRPFLDIRSSAGNFVVDVTEGDKVCDMSWLGKVEAEYRGELSSYEGMDHYYITNGHELNIEAIVEELKRSTFVSEMHPSFDLFRPPTFAWQDNHIALLLNLVRFAHLLKVYERQLGLKSRCQLKSYDDGHIRVNPADTFNDWGPEYSKNWKIHWPGGRDFDNYPDIAQEEIDLKL